MPLPLLTKWPFVAEFIGTILLVVLGDGVVANVLLTRSKGQNSGWIVITTGWALGVAVAVYCVGAFSGAHLNPAVTLGLAAIGQFRWTFVAGFITPPMFRGPPRGVGVLLAPHPPLEKKGGKGNQPAPFFPKPGARPPPPN